MPDIAMRVSHHGLSHRQLSAFRVTRHFFHRLRDLLARTFTLQSKTG